MNSIHRVIIHLASIISISDCEELMLLNDLTTYILVDVLCQVLEARKTVSDSAEDGL